MTDEKILMKKLDEMVLKGHGEELVYACSIAAGAAIGGYQKAERMRILAAAVIGAATVLCANKIKEKIKENRKSKDGDKEES